jgi:hypothetical protein
MAKLAKRIRKDRKEFESSVIEEQEKNWIKYTSRKICDKIILRFGA